MGVETRWSLGREDRRRVQGRAGSSGAGPLPRGGGPVFSRLLADGRGSVLDRKDGVLIVSAAS